MAFGKDIIGDVFFTELDRIPHLLIAGATGTGKTVTLQILAESFAANGVPVFLSDVKGDLSGLGAAGSESFKLHDAFMERAAICMSIGPRL